jgi:hypothetical protein
MSRRSLPYGVAHIVCGELETSAWQRRTFEMMEESRLVMPDAN